jgi:hypothetical protein
VPGKRTPGGLFLGEGYFFSGKKAMILVRLPFTYRKKRERFENLRE